VKINDETIERLTSEIKSTETHQLTLQEAYDNLKQES
jgi:streptogramin lyase